MADLAGKSVLLTGGLGTLGRAQARRLAAGGARVIVLDRPDSERGAERAAEIGPGISFMGCDLADLSGAMQAVARRAEEVGGIDILVNCAALIINRPFEDFDPAEFEEQMRVNAAAAFAMARACAPAMKEKRWGKIINFTSITLNGQIEGYVPYVATKGAMLGLTRALARELGPYGITVNAVAPGAIVSEAEERVFGHKAREYSDWVLDRQCLKVRIMPEDVAELVYFLASPASDRITGQNIGIDGGW